MYIKEKLAQLGFTETTPIQEGVFKAINNKKHLVGLAPTGTGKTHAYLLPILANLNFEIHEVQALICVPTNELVIQVEKMLRQTEDQVIVKAYYGSSDKQRELEWLRKSQPQMVIATPQRLKEYVIELSALKIKAVKYFVLDEADMMFDYAFLSLIDQLLPAMPKAKYLLFSASLSKPMEPFIKTYFGLHDFIDTSKDHTLKIEYRLVNIKNQDRLDVLKQVIKFINPYVCFVFVSKKENQEVIFQAIQEQNVDVVNLNATLGVKQRKKIIEDINNLKYQYVVTSDLAARGLDFKISHVIQYDLPHHLEFFLHRSGRTGRMNDTGMVITFMSVDDHRKIEKLKIQGIPFVNYLLTPSGFVKMQVRTSKMSQAETEAIKKIKKPTRVSPNYKKKNKAKITQAKKDVRRKQYAENR
ncbi:MAG: DEAD/DEAH box helicase [Acholeplasmataceae bacterium]|nr:DEAD/DEAH box helicase [Acholeplasmataceae bacterium]